MPAPRPVGREDRSPVLVQREDLFPLLPRITIAGRTATTFANPEFNASNQFIAPTDDINGVINFTTIISPGHVQ